MPLKSVRRLMTNGGAARWGWQARESESGQQRRRKREKERGRGGGRTLLVPGIDRMI